MKNLIGKRILIAETSSYGWNKSTAVKELKILEISPSEKWVKVMNEYGSKVWRLSTDIQPVEVLSDKEKYPTDK